MTNTKGKEAKIVTTSRDENICEFKTYTLDKRISKGGDDISRRTKLNIKFHNPNTDEDTLKYISKILIEASKTKLEMVLQEAANNNGGNNIEESSNKKEALCHL